MWNNSIEELVDELFEQTGPHGGPKETALIQHLAGELVRDDRLTDARDGGLTAWENADGLTVHGARTFYDSADNTDNGVLGDQTDARRERRAAVRGRHGAVGASRGVAERTGVSGAAAGASRPVVSSGTTRVDPDQDQGQRGSRGWACEPSVHTRGRSIG